MSLESWESSELGKWGRCVREVGWQGEKGV